MPLENVLEEYTPFEYALIAAIHDSYSNHSVSNAVFQAERLRAEKDTEETRIILAECYLKEAKPYKAFYVLRNFKSASARYLFALACFKQNKFKEAEKALLSDIDSIRIPGNSSSSKLDGVINGSHGIYLLGQIYEKQKKMKEAVECYRIALDKNPNLWTAFEKIVKISEFVSNQYDSIPNLFNENKFLSMKKNVSMNIFHKILFKDKSKSLEQISNVSSGKDILQTSQTFSNNTSNNKKTGNEMDIESMPPNTNQVNANLTSTNSVGSRLSANLVNNTPSGNSQGKNSPFTRFVGGQRERKDSRRGTNTNNNSFGNTISNNVVSNNNSGNSLNNSMIQNNPNSMPRELNTTSNNGSNSADSYTQSEIMTKLAQAYYLMINYKSQKAIEILQSLPKKHFSTGFVLTGLGRCNMDLGSNKEAEKFFAEANKKEPYRLEGIEYYSSCLWTLQKHTELSELALASIEKNPFSPEAWIAIGNCYSLQREHDTALQFFNRAIQLNQNMAYAHCLCGHEYIYKDDYQKAKKCYEIALVIDPKNFNAWWGMGNVYHKQEKYDRALDQFQKANEINDKNPIIWAYLGITHMNNNNFQDALVNFEKSEQLNNKFVQTRYHKAQVLVKQGYYEKAQKELHFQLESSPKEVQIYILIGKVYQKLGRNDKAHQYYVTAQDLDDKQPQRIKSQIDSLHNNNEFNEENDI